MALNIRPTTTLTLNEQEVSSALQKNGGGGAAEKAQDFIRKQLEEGGTSIKLKDVQLGMLIRLMSQGSGAVKAVLKRDFLRPVTELISRD